MKIIRLNLLALGLFGITLHASESTPEKRYARIKSANEAFTNAQVIARFPRLQGKTDLIDQARRYATQTQLFFKNFTEDKIVSKGKCPIPRNSSLRREQYKEIAASNDSLSNDAIRALPGGAPLTDDEINAARLQANKQCVSLSRLTIPDGIRKYAEKRADFNKKRQAYSARSYQNTKEKNKAAELLIQLNKQETATPAASSASHLRKIVWHSVTY